MVSPVDLCNQALDQIAARSTITSLEPPGPPNNLSAEVAARTYQTQVDAVFRAAHWNCARFQVDGTLLAAAIGTPENADGSLPSPPIPWRYIYAYPADCLLVRFVFPLTLPPATSTPIMTNTGVNWFPIINTSMPFVPAIWTNAQGNKVKVILTNASRAQIVYTARIPDVDLWDGSLQNAVIATLAAWFVNPIARNPGLLKERVAIAGALIEAARLTDGNEGISSVDHLPDWMSIRSVGGGVYGSLSQVPGGGYMASWDSLGMPNGVSF